jgi:PST family polysaccharide transporter
MSTESSAPRGQQIARKTAHGIFWNYASFGLGKGLVFLTITILARLLTPEDFGIVALATLAVTYLTVLKDFGLGRALIQRRQNIEEAANTVFTLNLLLGISLTLITIAVAPLVAAYFQEPSVTPILRWLSLTFLINAIGAIHLVRLERELEFKRKLIPDLGRAAVKGFVSIGCALTGFGVWALVYGQLGGALAGVILAWGMEPWRPRLTISLSLTRDLLKYGFSLLSLDAISTLEDNFDYLVIGRVLGNAALGVYTLAYRLPELLGLNMLWVMAAALFPAYASVQDRPDVLRRGFLTTIRFIEMLSVPVSLGLLLAADPLVRVIFGEQWLAAIPVVRILALFVLITSIGDNAGDIYKAIGRPDILVKLSLGNLVLLLPALWYGSFFGIVGVAIGHLAIGALQTILRVWLATRFIKVSLGDILLQLKPSFLSGLTLTLLVLPCLYITADVAPILRLIVIVLAGAGGYSITLWLLERETLLQAAHLIGLPGFDKQRVSSLVVSPPADVEAN